MARRECGKYDVLPACAENSYSPGNQADCVNCDAGYSTLGFTGVTKCSSTSERFRVAAAPWPALMACALGAGRLPDPPPVCPDGTFSTAGSSCTSMVVSNALRPGRLTADGGERSAPYRARRFASTSVRFQYVQQGGRERVHAVPRGCHQQPWLQLLHLRARLHHLGLGRVADLHQYVAGLHGHNCAPCRAHTLMLRVAWRPVTERGAAECAAGTFASAGATFCSGTAPAPSATCTTVCTSG